jgi:hypothetical protein
MQPKYTFLQDDSTDIFPVSEKKLELHFDSFWSLFEWQGMFYFRKEVSDI